MAIGIDILYFFFLFTFDNFIKNIEFKVIVQFYHFEILIWIKFYSIL